MDRGRCAVNLVLAPLNDRVTDCGFVLSLWIECDTHDVKLAGFHKQLGATAKHRWSIRSDDAYRLTLIVEREFHSDHATHVSSARNRRVH